MSIVSRRGADSASKPKQEISQVEFQQLLNMPPFIAPPHLQKIRFAEDFKELRKLEKAYREACLAKIRGQDPRASNDASAPAAAHGRPSNTLTFIARRLDGTQQTAVFRASGCDKDIVMNVGKVTDALTKSYFKASRKIQHTTKQDKAAVMADKRAARARGIEYLKAAENLRAIEGIRPRRAVRYFTRMQRAMDRAAKATL